MRRQSVIALMALAIMTACGGGGSKDVDTELGRYRQEAPAMVLPDTARDSVAVMPPLTSQGLGPVRLGMEPRALPECIPGVYDTIAGVVEVIDDEEVEMLKFLLGGSAVMTGEAVGEPRRLCRLTVTGLAGCLVTTGGRIGVGTPVAELDEIDGLLGVSDATGDYLEWRGVAIYTDGDSVACMTVRSR